MSSWPSIAAEKIVGGAPCSIRNSAIGRFPTCDAAPSAVSQSPNPQSHEAFASDGCAVTSSLTRARSLCETPTISRARCGCWLGKDSSRHAGVDGGAGHTGPACCSCCASARADAKGKHAERRNNSDKLTAVQRHSVLSDSVFFPLSTFHFLLSTFYFFPRYTPSVTGSPCDVLLSPHRHEHHREVLGRRSAVPVIRAAWNERALANRELFDWLPLKLHASSSGLREHQLPCRVHVPRRVARARCEDATPDREALRVERGRVAGEVRRGSEDAELRRRAGRITAGAGVGYVGELGGTGCAGAAGC